nr:PREDICTED: uncharacterized protein LOC109033754 [Bemisia tabaci]
MILFLLGTLAVVALFFKFCSIKLTFSIRNFFSRTVPPLSLLPTETEILLEKPKPVLNRTQDPDSLLFFGASKTGVKIFAEIKRRQFNSAAIDFVLTLSDGTTLESCDSASCLLYCQNWSTNFLTFEVVESMKTWRIVYNGNLKNNQISPASSHHVKINLLWHAMSVPVFFRGNTFDPEYNVSSKSETTLREEFSGYEQWGTMVGIIQSKMSDGKYLEEEIRLQSFRRRSWRTVDHSKQLILIDEIGNKFSFFLTTGLLRKNKSDVCGHIQRTIRVQEYIKLSVLNYQESGAFKKLTFSDSRNNYSFIIKVANYTRDSIQFASWHSASEKGVGFQITPSLCEPDLIPDLSSLLRVYATECISNSTDLAVLPLSSAECCQVAIVGGKAASLAYMQIGKKLNFIKNALIPPGICLTTSTLEQHLEIHQNLKNAVYALKDLGPDVSDAVVQEKCERITSIWASTPISAELSEILNRFLQPETRYAVRSSGIHEDGENISAAGQNETFLNVSGVSEISEAVKNCWASLFSFRSLKYRRQHGLPVVTSMGVIIQEMAPADAAGVMFSRDPVSGDPSLIVINATRGLGDAVVSGTVNPDYITVHRDGGSKFSIIDQKAGNRDSNPLCLTSAQIMELSKVCMDVERIFGFSCDIEWAVAKDKIYLLQARPITSTLVWSDFEIIHEFDTSFTEDDVQSTYNVGEIFPSATTPLTMTTFGLWINIVHHEHSSLKRINEVLYRYVPCGITFSHQRLLFDIQWLLLREFPKEVNRIHLIAQLIFAGKIFANEEIYTLAFRRFRSEKYLPKLLFGLAYFKMVLSQLWNSVFLSFFGTLRRDHMQNFEVVSSGEAFALLPEAYEHYEKALMQHIQVSAFTGLMETITVAVLTENENDFTNDTFSDMSLLMTTINKDVYSMRMPLLLEKFCTSMRKSCAVDQFCNIPPNMAHHFLKKTCPDAHLILEELIKDFGHRGISEMELMSDNWLTKPDSLIELLQRLVKNDSPPKTIVDSNEDLSFIIQSLKTPRKDFTRKLLKILTPIVRKTVELRELSKNELVATTHRLRVIYIALGNALTREGRIPDPSLIYFMSFPQLATIMHTTDSLILQKALRRKRLWPTMKSFIFPDVAIGWPQPTVRKVNLEPGTTSVKGMPVHLGEASGRACVVKSLDDCSQIRDGDILVTNSIDIGWSAYFPLLQGIVVEMGGIISHGVVVAREYGLPALVDATNATDIFNTGDAVYLDAKNGVLSKVSC